MAVIINMVVQKFKVNDKEPEDKVKYQNLVLKTSKTSNVKISVIFIDIHRSIDWLQHYTDNALLEISACSKKVLYSDFR